MCCQFSRNWPAHPKTIKIRDTGKGRKSVGDDLEAVLRKIEELHQGSIAGIPWKQSLNSSASCYQSSLRPKIR
jgi:hypothetical protein